MFIIMLLASCADEIGATTPAAAALDPFAGAPACNPLPGDGRVDLEAGCADGACAGGTLSEWTDALGAPAECEPSSDSAFRCEWNVGVKGYFDDEDGDGVVDATSTAGVLYVKGSYDGASGEGLGLGVSTACFGEAFGPADALSMERSGDTYLVTEAHFPSPEIEVEDTEGVEEDVPDGHVDEVRLHGP